MTSKNLLVFLVAALVLVASIGAVSATHLGEITKIEVNGVDALDEGDIDFANFAGQRVPVLVVFEAADNGNNHSGETIAEDVRVTVWLSGESRNAVESTRFDIIEGRTYSRTVLLDLPYDLDDELEESRVLEVRVESEKEGELARESVDLTVQRESYLLEILSVNVDSKVDSGESLAVDVVVKNRGRNLAEDTFVRVAIPGLGIEERAYFGDLSATDQSNPDKEDAVERRIYLRIPRNAASGVYDLEVEAFDEDSIARTTKKVLVGGGSAEDTIVVASVNSRNLAVGQIGQYSMTLVNQGNSVRLYQLSVDGSSNVNVDLTEPVVVVPAGSSRTVTIEASPIKEGTYTFVVNVNSDGQIIESAVYTVNSEGEAKGNGIGTAGDATLLLTIVLAVIFVVLLVVLIVLLTRRPEKTEEFGESYY